MASMRKNSTYYTLNMLISIKISPLGTQIGECIAYMYAQSSAYIFYYYRINKKKLMFFFSLIIEKVKNITGAKNNKFLWINRAAAFVQFNDWIFN